MISYIVTGEYINAKVVTPTGPTVVGYYKGAVLPESVTDEHLKHLLRKGLVEEVEEPQPETAKEPSVKDILAQVGEDPEAAMAALEAEQAKGEKARKSLIEGLEAVITAPGK